MFASNHQLETAMALVWDCDRVARALRVRVAGGWPDDDESAAAAVDVAFARAWYPGVKVLLDLREAHDEAPAFKALARQWQSWMDLLGNPGCVAFLIAPGVASEVAESLAIIFRSWDVPAFVHVDEAAAIEWLGRRDSVVPETWGMPATL